MKSDRTYAEIAKLLAQTSKKINKLEDELVEQRKIEQDLKLLLSEGQSKLSSSQYKQRSPQEMLKLKFLRMKRMDAVRQIIESHPKGITPGDVAREMFDFTNFGEYHKALNAVYGYLSRGVLERLWQKLPDAVYVPLNYVAPKSKSPKKNSKGVEASSGAKPDIVSALGKQNTEREDIFSDLGQFTDRQFEKHYAKS
jgi:flagellar biosynthesis/type III secretory pathway chaperone